MVLEEVFSAPGQHDRQVDFIAIRNAFRQFIRIGACRVDKDLDITAKASFPIEKSLFHGRELPDQVIEALSHSSPVCLYALQSMGMLTVGLVNVYVDGQFILLF